MYLYVTGPIDDWSGWQKPEEMFRVRVRTDLPPFELSHRDADEWPRLWNQAQDAAGRQGGENDIREGPYVSVLPNPDGFCSEVIIAWKLNNNGTTFIASPFPLPWLEPP